MRGATDTRVDANDAALGFMDATADTWTTAEDLGALLQAVIDAATRSTGAAFGAFFYRRPPAMLQPGDGGDDSLSIALSGVTAPRRDEFDALGLASAFASAWTAHRSLRCDDVLALAAGDGRLLSQLTLPGSGSSALRSFLAVPVVLCNGEGAGGLFFGHPQPGVFDARMQRLAEGIARHAAVALENVFLLEDRKSLAQERERLVGAERRSGLEAARAARIKDEFLSTLSHELRTPLTAILGWARLLLQRDEESLRRKGLEAIARNAQVQADLIDELLDMSRIISGQVTLDCSGCDLSTMVQDCIASLQSAASAKAIELTARTETPALVASCDAARVRQVVAHLVTNAIRFTPRQGRVNVELRREGDDALIVVCDTGMGIAPEFLPHVFDDFRQADGSTTRRHAGLGLGLAMVNRLVQMHGGSSRACSEGAGRGACFEIRLPIQGRVDRAGLAASGLASSRDVRTGTPVDLKGLDLLVVDDETDARELVVQVLIEAGANVRQADCAAQAMREFMARPPDVLISDIGMPERDGYELIREIRRLSRSEGSQVPAIALTAFVGPRDREQALSAGFQEHLSKPIRPRTLAAVVAGLAERRVLVAARA